MNNLVGLTKTKITLKKLIKEFAQIIQVQSVMKIMVEILLFMVRNFSNNPKFSQNGQLQKQFHENLP